MKIFDSSSAAPMERGGAGILDAVQRVADEVIAPSAAAYDKSGEFPDNNVAPSTRSA